MSEPDPPIVLLHGLATNAARTWHENGWVDILSDEGRRCVTPDLPGHGHGGTSDDPETYREFESQVLASFPDEPCDVIGFSLGARTAAIIAATHPERVRRLVLAGVGENLFRSEGHGALLAAALSDLDRDQVPEPPELAAVAHHFAQLARSCGQELSVLAAVLRRPDIRPLTAEDLSGVRAPTLVALGDRDPAGPAEPLLDALATATLLTLKGVDHFATPRSMSFISGAIDHLAG